MLRMLAFSLHSFLLQLLQTKILILVQYTVERNESIWYKGIKTFMRCLDIAWFSSTEVEVFWYIIAYHLAIARTKRTDVGL